MAAIIGILSVSSGHFRGERLSARGRLAVGTRHGDSPVQFRRLFAGWIPLHSSLAGLRDAKNECHPAVFPWPVGNSKTSGQDESRPREIAPRWSDYHSFTVGVSRDNVRWVGWLIPRGVGLTVPCNWWRSCIYLFTRQINIAN